MVLDVRELKIAGAWELTPQQHSDDRGAFLEWFRADVFEALTGHRFTLAQANCSVSSAGTLRGIHFAQLPPSQAKYVTCPSGAVFDVVVDLRAGSPTFSQWDSVELDDVNRRAVYLSEGLGHAFMALTDGAIVDYLCSAPYAPGREHGVNPFDPGIAVAWPSVGRNGAPLTPRLSPKDEQAPTLAELRESALLPSFADVQQFVESLRYP